MDVVGVGALNVDLLYEVPSLQMEGMELVAGGTTYGTEERFYQPVQELTRTGRLMGRSAGGSAANTIFALARLGYQTAFLGVVGKDKDGAFILESMSGVDVSGVKRYKNSGKCISLLAPGESSKLVLPNANDFFSYTEDDIALLNTSKFVHMGPFVADSALASQKMLLEYLDENVYLSFSPGEPYARRGIAQLRPLLERTRILFLNRSEMKLLTGKRAGRRREGAAVNGAAHRGLHRWGRKARSSSPATPRWPCRPSAPW